MNFEFFFDQYFIHRGCGQFKRATNSLYKLFNIENNFSQII